MSDTIYAQATPPGKSGVAVVRVSGAAAAQALAALGVKLPRPRVATYSSLNRSGSGLLAANEAQGTGHEALIDKALILWFPAPNSFTGEDVAELHLHGSHAVIQEVFSVLGGLPGFRMALPGEFSRRAFENGKMDLTEAEGLADLIDAETKEQQKLAMRQMQGELHRLYEGWRAQLIASMAFIEAYIDFPDENLPPELEQQFTGKIEALLAEMQVHLADGGRGQRLREGARLVILGAPNAGKSSLLNYLAKSDLAIVSAIPGTTRDALSVHLDIAGYPVTLIDTAGIRESSDPIEQEGVRRALAKAEEADIRIVLLDGETYPEISPQIKPYIDNSIIIVTKSDLSYATPPRRHTATISVKTGEGIPALMEEITSKLQGLMSPPASPALTRQRHREGVLRAAASLEALLASPKTTPPELRAEHLRTAAQATSALTGRIDLEDVLDHLFGQFCIGK